MDARLDLDVHLPAIASGDAAAFGRFIAGCEPDVRRALRPFAASVDVEAVVQEAFLRAWQLAPRVTPDGRGNSLVRFVIRAARNLAISEVRRKREELPGDLRPEDAPIDAEIPDPLLRQHIADCFEKLPKQPSVAIRMRLESAGANADLELAERCGMRLNTFLQNVTRAKKLLAECLERLGVTIPGSVMTTEAEAALLIEEVASAYRERDPHGVVRSSPAFHDLTPEERVRAFDATVRARAMESALDAAGLSTTARAILSRIR